MQQPDRISTRKKFLLGGAAILTSLTALKIFFGRKSNTSHNSKDSSTVKMLTRDGKLVEVDADKLYCGKRKKISDEQLKNWITKKTDDLK